MNKIVLCSSLVIITALLTSIVFNNLFWNRILLLLTSIPKNMLPVLVLFFTVAIFFQALFTMVWMLYAWENPNKVKHFKSPTKFIKPKRSFTALIPARHEEKVIKDTIIAVNSLNYPERLKEVLILCRSDDSKTIKKAQETIRKLNKNNIKLVIFKSFPINKPHALNHGLRKAKNQIIAVFDAEDEPHRDIYQIINTIIVREKADVIQSGVQLINYHSHWFSALNALEYYFWFKSGLAFFTKIGKISPLGGNSVFIGKKWLNKVGGWDENSLTEDADLGIKLTLVGAKTRMVYDEQHATQEETPSNTVTFIKQRTRWIQGFLQILLKGEWTKLPLWHQKAVIVYVLLSPLTPIIILTYIPFSLYIAFSHKLPVILALISFIPLILLGLQLLVLLVGLLEFNKAYRFKMSIWIPFKVLLYFFPYQIMLLFALLRAIHRILTDKGDWEKTYHSNSHRNNFMISV